MFRVSVGRYSLSVRSSGLPEMHGAYVRHAALVEQFDLSNSEGEFCFVAVASCGQSWPFLVVEQRYQPSSAAGFHPGALFVPETETLFIGAGERLLGYDLGRRQRLWQDRAECGFWSWQRHDSYVLMSAELELAAWDTAGNKKWTTFVEPPWEYHVSDGSIHLDVMGSLSTLDIETGIRSKSTR